MKSWSLVWTKFGSRNMGTLNLFMRSRVTDQGYARSKCKIGWKYKIGGICKSWSLVWTNFGSCIKHEDLHEVKGHTLVAREYENVIFVPVCKLWVQLEPCDHSIHKLQGQASLVIGGLWHIFYQTKCKRKEENYILLNNCPLIQQSYWNNYG